MAPEDPLPELSSLVPAAPAKPTEASAGGRKQDTRGPVASTNEKSAQPPAAAIDVNVPVPVAPKLRSPAFTDGGSAEQSAMKPAAVSGTEEPAATMLQPKPLLEVKIHLDQPATGQSTPTAPNEESVPQSPEDIDPTSRRDRKSVV